MRHSKKYLVCHILFVWITEQVLSLNGTTVDHIYQPFKPIKRSQRHKRDSVGEKEKVSFFDSLYKLIPEGCYGSKQLRDIIMYKFSKSTFKPITPPWCTDNGFVVSDRLGSHRFATTKPPYQIRVYPGKQSRNIFRVVLKSEGSDASIEEAIIVARSVDGRTNVGRFVKSDGVHLYCCSLSDKDVARFLSESRNVKEVVFYWSPNEELVDDFEGTLLFMATVAKSQKEYWVNVTSKPIYVASATTLLFGDIPDNIDLDKTSNNLIRPVENDETLYS